MSLKGTTQPIKRTPGLELRYKTSVISIMASHFDCKHSCRIEKNVPMAFILFSIWRDGAESLGIETTSCLWFYHICVDLEIDVVYLSK